MAAVVAKSKKSRQKLPKSRPQTTSQLSQPVTDDAWTSSLLTAFSSDSERFALVSLAVDKHRLRIFDVAASNVVAEHTIDDARVTALLWVPLDLSDSPSINGSPKKKRKKSDKDRDTEKGFNATIQAVALGLSDGTVQIYSISHGRVVRSLSVPSSSAAILAIENGPEQNGTPTLWVSDADGVLRLWDTKRNTIIKTVSTSNKVQYSALARLPNDLEDDAVCILAATNSIHLLAIPEDESSTTTAKETSSYTGHASPVTALVWEPKPSTPLGQFYSSAEGDRFVYIWDVPDSSSKGKLSASCPVDSDVRRVTATFAQGRKILSVLSKSGKISLVPVPSDLGAPDSKSSKAQVPTLLPRSSIALSTKKNGPPATIIDMSFDSKDERIIRIAVGGGAQVGFETLSYIGESDEFIPEINVDFTQTALATRGEKGGLSAFQRRYTEPSDLSISAGEHVGSSEPLNNKEIDGALDVDLAELSLGQRLAVRNRDNAQVDAQSSESGQDEEEGSSSKKRKAKSKRQEVPTHSLSRTLTQALHSSDTGLLESCLRHTNKDVIHNTVQRLPPQLVVPLLMACVERLGRGARGNNMKGGGGGASTQRGLGLIAWVKAALTIHSGHLMTMPDLVARLSHLHATLTSRLALQEQLLGLNGRLDLVLSQVELRSSSAPAPIRMKSSKQSAGQKTSARGPYKYVEGDSSDEDDEQMDVEIEDADDDGSVEDVELGGLSDELASEEGSEEEGGSEDDFEDDGDMGDSDVDEDEDDVDAHGNLNGFIDDEAEEDYEEDESEEDSE